MTLTGRRELLALGSATLLSEPTPARQAAAPAGTIQPNDRAEAAFKNAETVGVLGSELPGIPIRFAVDLANALDDGTTLRVLPIVGQNGYQDAEDLLFLRGVDVAFFPSNLFVLLKEEQRLPTAEKMIRYIAKLYDAELHVIAHADVQTLQDLAGRKVNIGPSGSWSAIIVTRLFRMLGIKPDLQHDNNNTATVKMVTREISAMIFYSGKPVDAIATIPPQTVKALGLHFVAIPATPALLESYLPAELDHASYPTLVAAGQSVETIAVGEVMAAYAWPEDSGNARRIRRFVDAMFFNFERLKAPQDNQRWKDVNLNVRLAGWTRLPAAEEALTRFAASGGGP